MRVGAITHPLGTGRNGNTRCREMEKRTGKQAASLPWARAPQLAPGITGNSPKGNGQWRKKLGECQIWSSCPNGGSGVSWEFVVDDDPKSNCTARGHPSPKLPLLPQPCHHSPTSQRELKIRRCVVTRLQHPWHIGGWDKT